MSVRVALPAGVPDAVARAVAAEAAGFDQIWFGNDIFGTSGVVAVAAAMAATSRIHIGLGVFEPVSIHPVQIAMMAAGLQQMSNGRFLLGMGAGSEVFFGFAGLTRPAPVRRTAEAIIAVRTLLAGGCPADDPAAGAGWTAQARLAHPPAAAPPIYVGAMGPQMLAMSGRVADGALPLCLPPERFARAAADIARGAATSGRTLEHFDLVACLWCSIDPDPQLARRRLAGFIARYSGSLPAATLAEEGFDPAEFAHVQEVMLRDGDEAGAAAVTADMLRLGIAGSANDVVERCRRLVAAGARHISFGPPLAGDVADALATLGSEVLPQLRPSSSPHPDDVDPLAALARASITVTADELDVVLADRHRPGGVRLGILTLGAVDPAVTAAVDRAVAASGHDPERRVARLRPTIGATEVTAAELISFIDRYGHEYSLAVLPEDVVAGADSPIEAAARRAGVGIIRVATHR